jgi:hypothetical protein
LLFKYEPGILFFSFISLFFNKRDNISIFLIFWTFLGFIIYSIIPYKANWVLYVIIFPFILLSGITFDYLYNRFKKYRFIIYLITAVFIFLNFYNSILQNFIYINNFEKNKIGYVETSTDISRLIKDINNYEDKYPNSKILISANSYWPIPAYLDKYYINYLSDITQLDLNNYPDYNIIIANENQLTNIPENFNKDTYELRQYYYLSVLLKNNSL